MKPTNFIFCSGSIDAIPAETDRRFWVVSSPAEDEHRYTGPKLRTTDDGSEKFCTRCMEWWPADLEFFYSDPGGAAGLNHCCKACYREWKAANDVKKAVRRST